MAELTGKSCLVTGGSRGIGRAIALELGRHCACVAVAYHSDEIAHGHEAQPNAVTAEIMASGGQAFAIGCDVRDPASINAAVASVIERSGSVDILVNNAGITRDRSLAKMSQRGVGCRPPDEPVERLPPDRTGAAAHGRSRLRPGHQPQLRRRSPRQLRSGELRRGQGRDRRLHQVRGARARPQGRHGQRDRARLHRDPDDRSHARRRPHPDPREDPDGSVRASGGDRRVLSPSSSRKATTSPVR